MNRYKQIKTLIKGLIKKSQFNQTGALHLKKLKWKGSLSDLQTNVQG